jgi:hypothetical protein
MDATMLGYSAILIRARKFLDEHGRDAISKAANNVRSFEERGDEEQAETWRRILEVLTDIQYPNGKSDGR